jgi:hypothetical protein
MPMQNTIQIPTEKLLQLGIAESVNIHYQLNPEELVEQALERRGVWQKYDN